MNWLIISWLLPAVISTGVIYLIWKKDCPSQHTVKAFVNHSDIIFMWIPVLNILAIIVFIVGFIIKFISKIKIK